MIWSNIICERNVFISIVRTDEPFGISSRVTGALGGGLEAFEITAGNMEVIDIEGHLKRNGIV